MCLYVILLCGDSIASYQLIYSFSKVNYYDTHVVAPFALSSIYVGGQKGVH